MVCLLPWSDRHRWIDEQDGPIGGNGVCAGLRTERNGTGLGTRIRQECVALADNIENGWTSSHRPLVLVNDTTVILSWERADAPADRADQTDCHAQ